MTYEEVGANVRAINQARPNPLPGDMALRDYLTPENLPRISDTALARYSSYYALDRGSYGIEIVSIVAGEQERRRQIEENKVLRWSQVGAWAAIAAAILGAIAVAFK